MFNILFLNASKYYALRDLRITVDYEEDYKLVKELFEINQYISLEEVIELYKKGLRIFDLNKNCIQNKVR